MNLDIEKIKALASEWAKTLDTQKAISTRAEMGSFYGAAFYAGYKAALEAYDPDAKLVVVQGGTCGCTSCPMYPKTPSINPDAIRRECVNDTDIIRGLLDVIDALSGKQDMGGAKAREHIARARAYIIGAGKE